MIRSDLERETGLRTTLLHTMTHDSTQRITGKHNLTSHTRSHVAHSKTTIYNTHFSLITFVALGYLRPRTLVANHQKESHLEVDPKRAFCPGESL